MKRIKLNVCCNHCRDADIVDCIFVAVVDVVIFAPNKDVLRSNMNQFLRCSSDIVGPTPLRKTISRQRLDSALVASNFLEPF